MSSYGNVPIDEYSKQSLGNSSNSNSQEGSEFFSDSASPIKPQDANSSFLEASKSQDPNSQKTSTSISSSVSSSSNTCNKLNDYKLIRTIGKGGFGSVFLYVDLKTGFPCAIKKIESKSFEKEEQIGYISKLKSICLMKYYDMFELNNNLYIVMQYFENGSLHDLIKSHREKNQKIDIFVTKRIFRSLFSGIYSLHEEGIVHRDIKPDNVFIGVNNGYFVLGDYGLSLAIKDLILERGLPGTDRYMAPEIYEEGMYSSLSDVWAMGMTMYEVMTLRNPYEGMSWKEIKTEHESNKYPQIRLEEVKGHYDEEFVKVINKMLSPFKERPGLKNILTIGYVRDMLLESSVVTSHYSLFSSLSDTSGSDYSEKNWEQSLGENLKQLLGSDGDIKEILSKLTNLYGVKEVEMMMIKHKKDLEEVKKKMKEMKELINKIFSEPKEKEKLELLIEVLEKIPSNDECDEDIFYLDVILSFIYKEVCEMRHPEFKPGLIRIRINDEFEKILTHFEDLFLKHFDSYQKKRHKLLMIIILLLKIECSNIPSKEFNLFPLISELFNNNSEEILMKKFQYPILKIVTSVVGCHDVKKDIYIHSKFFNNKISILLPHIFGKDLVSNITRDLIYFLSQTNDKVKKKKSVADGNNSEEREVGEKEISVDFINSIYSIDLNLLNERPKLSRTIFLLLHTLDNFLNMMEKSFLEKSVKHEHVLLLSKYVMNYVEIVDFFLSLSSVVSLTLHHLFLDINKRFLDINKRSVILEISKKLLERLKQALKNLDEMKDINSSFYRMRGCSLNVTNSAFELLKGVMRVFNIFKRHKDKQHKFGFDFLFKEYDSMHVNVRLVNFIRKLLINGKLIIFLSICNELFEYEDFEDWNDFYPFVFYLFILKRTINPNMCYDNCDFPSFLNKYPSNFIINLTLLKYCDRLLKNINNPIIIILQSLFSERKRRKWIKVNELKLLIEIFSDVNEDIMTAKEFDETSEKYLDDVTDFILEGKRKEKEKEKKKNSHEEMLLNDLTVVIITRIYKTIMESSNEEYKKRLSKRIEDKNIIIRIISLLEMKDESLYIKNYYNMLRLVLNEYEEISEEKRFKEIIIPMLDFIKKHYMNGRCDSSSSSSSSSSPLSGCVSMSVVSDGIISTSLEVLLYYVKEEDSERQPRLLESEIIEVLFPLMIHSSSSNVKRCISRIIRILCENERNKKDLIYKCKICEYFKLILTLLYKKLNIVVKEEESDLQTNQNDDQVKYYVYNNRDNECEMCVYDYTKHIEQIIFSFKLLSSSEMDESSFPWRYTSLCCLYSSLETLSNFVCGLMNLLQFKVESGILDQAEEKFVKEVINSFDILQKILEIPKIVFILREFKEQLPFLLVYSISIEIIGRYILVCWKISPDDDQAKSMIFLSLLNFSMECVKSSLFVYFPLDVKVEIYHFVCAMMHDIVDSKIEESNKYPDLIRSYFDKSGWTEWLIHIFNTLKAFPSSPHSDSDLIPSLSFFSSVSSSEYTHTIIYLTAKTIEMLLKSNTPKAVVEYLELT